MFNKQKSKDAKDGKVRRDDQPRNAQLKPEPGGSSSKGQTKKPLDPSETLARRLQKEEDTIVKETSRKQPSIVYDDSPLKGKTKETKPQVADSRCHQPTKAHETPDRPTPSSEEYPNKIQDALDSLREYHGRIMAIRCHKCRHNITADFTVKGHIAGWEKSLDNGQQECISAVKCPVSNCLTKTCLGCGKPPQVGTNKATTSGIVLDWCCDGGKLFAIWLFLARYDELELETQNESAKAVLEAQKKASRRGKTDTGHGYAIGSDEGFINHMVGRRVALGFDPHDPGYGVSMSFNFKSSDLKTDRFVKKISGFLYHLLPNQNHKVSKSEFEIKPPAALKAILQLSLLLDKLAELLRNDSLSDLTSRADLYFKILRLVQVIGGHRDLVGLISKERFAKRLTSGLKVLSVPASKRGVSSGRNGRQSLLILEEESASSVISRVENLYKQSQIILSQYKNVKREFADAEGQDTINLCNEIVKSYSTIVDTEKAKGSVHGKEKNEWASFHAENMVEEIDMVEDSYHFSRSLEQLRHQRSLPRGRISYLVKEIATLATSLPDGIFVKVSPSTPGVLKALIIGPKDTPYEGGLFEFDIFAGANYPMEPPIVFFGTTYGGTVSFNPNLYPNGKTCLSLLGTFASSKSEEQWQAKKSTILQVLVSIQAMIFCEDPCNNVPAFGMKGFDPERIRQSNKMYQTLTIAYAMLDHLTSKSQMTGVWAKVIKKHFRVHGKEILHVVKRWARGNQHLYNCGSGRRNPVAELEKALSRI